MTATSVSIIMPARNAARWIDRAVRSVLAQAYPALDLVVVDDGSQDETAALCRRYGERVRLVQQPARGVSAARNRGLETCGGVYAGFLDADDELRPGAVTALAGALDAHPEAAAAAGAWLEEGPGYRRRLPPPGALLPAGRETGPVNYFEAAARYPAIAWTGAVMARREVVRALGGFRETLRFGEDIEMWNRVAGRHPWIAVDKVVAVYHRHPDSSVTARVPCEAHGLDFFYDEAAMRARIDPRYWAAFRVYRREQLLARARVAFADGAWTFGRRALRRIAPAPLTRRWVMWRTLYALPHAVRERLRRRLRARLPAWA